MFHIHCPGCNAIIDPRLPACRACGRCPNCGDRRIDIKSPCDCGIPFCSCCGTCPACGNRREVEHLSTCACGHPVDRQKLIRLIAKFRVRIKR
jgi:hypothetical protein